MRSRMVRVLGIVFGALIAGLVFAIVAAMVAFSPQYVLRVLAWQESDAFDWKKFPARELQPAATSFQFEEDPDSSVQELFQSLSGVDDWDAFLEDTETQAFIVIQDGKVLYECYFNDTQRGSIVTSFSVAKSYTSALIGIAIDEGYIGSEDDPITVYLPELASSDSRFESITLRHLLLMASGLDYQANRSLLFDGDDPLTTYYPDQRKITLENTQIIDPPGEYFRYNKYHPQLLGMVLERATGMTVTGYLQSRIWDPLGMEYGGSWSLDSEQSGFEKMETGVNARAIDFAKFGQLYLDGGSWQGKQVISQDWVLDSTSPQSAQPTEDYYSEFFRSMPGRGYYGYMWWGMARGDNDYDYTAEGDKGQFIYISPHKNLLIIRNGIVYGIPSTDWLDLFYRFASEF